MAFYARWLAPKATGKRLESTPPKLEEKMLQSENFYVLLHTHS